MKKLTLPLVSGVALAAMTAPLQAQTVDEVATHYADIAHAAYSDSLTTAKSLQASVDALLENPSKETLSQARQAWIDARVPYMQTEVYRFGNPMVDEWEGKVNAWPLDEGLIDYVDASYGNSSDTNPYYAANVIANETLQVNGETIDASEFTPEFLSETLQEAAGIEANVATGYHGIEFMLWGQDLNGTNAGSGDRPYTDFDVDNCTNGNCDRRGEYLSAVTDLLITDLEEMVAAWSDDGAAREALLEKGDAALSAIFTGIGSLSYGELAGERMKLGLLLHDPEEEHDCFADNTDKSHYYDVKGIQNVYLGEYERVNGEVLEGPSVYEYIKANSSESAELAEELKSDIEQTMMDMQAIVDRADNGEAYDQQIAVGNEEGNQAVQNAIDTLVAQTRTLERAVATLDVEDMSVLGSDSLDNPDAVFE